MTNPHFSLYDWSFFIIYLAFLLWIGLRRNRITTEDYLIANRNLSLPVFVATLVATWYGGILGAGEFVYTDGLAAWAANGLPYYLFAILFALFLAKRVRQAGSSLYTIPDRLEMEYDRGTALLGALLAFLYATPSQYVLMLGILLQLLFGWPLWLAMLVGTLFSIIYALIGGFLADVRVNTLQFLLMFSGFILTVAFCLKKFGGVRPLLRTHPLPPHYFTALGNHNMLWLLAWSVIALQTFTDPGFHQRCYAAKTPRIATLGILVAVICWFTFDSLTFLTGLFARVLFPNLSDPTLAFPIIAAQILPHGLRGFFYVGMLAPIMAATVSYTFISAMTIGRDFIWRLRNEAGPQNVPRYTRIGLVLTSFISIGIALVVRSVVEQWYLFGNLIVSGLLLPLVGAYLCPPKWKIPARYAFQTMLYGSLVAFLDLGLGWWHYHGNYQDLWGIPPLIPGLLVSASFYLLGVKQTAKMQTSSL
ncbi:MAG TPA: sodium:solute symporter family protein [Chthonomonas sp.]|jgi:SSS family solute:Na+ symporter|uniref:sodium:solute symporter family protein n=1 Tax=Chthonomonas sp. TaxID=2282153 RepID=UPI002B4B4C7C|nr:sodium:solute symporter family protein [Chthonomonas sp.]HLH80265.1 sodium:solute symporter family protein [Chthonomonas sp.]